MDTIRLYGRSIEEMDNEDRAVIARIGGNLYRRAFALHDEGRGGMGGDALMATFAEYDARRPKHAGPIMTLPREVWPIYRAALARPTLDNGDTHYHVDTGDLPWPGTYAAGTGDCHG